MGIGTEWELGDWRITAVSETRVESFIMAFRDISDLWNREAMMKCAVGNEKWSFGDNMTKVFKLKGFDSIIVGGGLDRAP